MAFKAPHLRQAVYNACVMVWAPVTFVEDLLPTHRMDIRTSTTATLILWYQPKMSRRCFSVSNKVQQVFILLISYAFSGVESIDCLNSV